MLMTDTELRSYTLSTRYRPILSVMIHCYPSIHLSIRADIIAACQVIHIYHRNVSLTTSTLESPEPVVSARHSYSMCPRAAPQQACCISCSPQNLVKSCAFSSPTCLICYAHTNTQNRVLFRTTFEAISFGNLARGTKYNQIRMTLRTEI